jgi:hypothetical protein
MANLNHNMTPTSQLMQISGGTSDWYCRRKIGTEPLFDASDLKANCDCRQTSAQSFELLSENKLEFRRPQREGEPSWIMSASSPVRYEARRIARAFFGSADARDCQED